MRDYNIQYLYTSTSTFICTSTKCEILNNSVHNCFKPNYAGIMVMLLITCSNNFRSKKCI